MAIVQAHISWDDKPMDQHEGLFQMKQLLAGLPQQLSDGLILCGDWNVPPNHFVTETACKRGFIHAFRGNEQVTHTGMGRPMMIDHIIHSPTILAQPIQMRQFKAESSYPNDTEGSDHAPLAVKVDWVY